MPSIAQTRDKLKKHGITLSWKSDSGEYRVNVKDGKQDTAYYTNDLDDAYATGVRMATERDKGKVALACDAYIYKDITTDPVTYEIWLVPVGDGHNIINGFIAGTAPTFDAATATILAVKGMTIKTIHAGEGNNP